MATRVALRVWVLLAAGTALAPASAAEVTPDANGEAVFDLNEVSVFQLDRRVHSRFVGGQGAPCTADPCSAVTAYPVFAS
jgi:hypothetical protein